MEEEASNKFVITDELSMWAASYLTFTLGIETFLWIGGGRLIGGYFEIPFRAFIFLGILIFILIRYLNFLDNGYNSLRFLSPVFFLPLTLIIALLTINDELILGMFSAIYIYFLIRYARNTVGKLNIIILLIFSLIISLEVASILGYYDWRSWLPHEIYYLLFYGHLGLFYVFSLPLLIILHNYHYLPSGRKKMKLIPIQFMIFTYVAIFAIHWEFHAEYYWD